MTQSDYSQFICRTIALSLCAITFICLPGCVTETTGGLPGPAPKETRVKAQLELARGYMEKRDWIRAKPPLQRALQIDSASVEAHVLSGVMYQAEGEPRLAEGHFKRALRIDPENPQALNNYGSFLYAEERFNDALVPLSTLVENPDYRARPRAYESLGLTYIRVGSTTKAISAFRRALELNFQLARANLELALILFEEGQVKEASQHFFLYNRVGKPTGRSTCLGLKIALIQKDENQEARYRLSLNNLFPDQSARCLKTL